MTDVQVGQRGIRKVQPSTRSARDLEVRRLHIGELTIDSGLPR